MIVKSAILVNGEVYTGIRHSDIIVDLVLNHGYNPPIKMEQGFITDDGTFLNRKDAKVHFESCGQSYKSKFQHATELFSEDLY